MYGMDARTSATTGLLYKPPPVDLHCLITQIQLANAIRGLG